MTNFLYIAHFFPPISSVESKLNYTTVDIFKKQGFSPLIISSDYKNYSLDKSNCENNLLIFRYDFREKNKYLRYARAILRIPECPINFSDYKRIIKIAEELIKKYDIKFIYSVFGRGIEHIAAKELKYRYNLPLILEFQDPWTNNKILQKYIDEKSSGFYRSFLKRQISRKEKEVITSADMILVESPLHKQFLEKKYGIGNIYVNLLGFNKNFIEDASKDELIEFTHKPIIGFIGSTYYGCEDICLNFMRALKRLEDASVDFTFISTGDTFNKLEDKINLKNHIPLMRVGYQKALKFMNSLDMGLVLILPNYPENINSKMFEYIAFRKLVIAIAPEEGDMAKIIQENNFGVTLPYTEEGMYQKLKELIEDYNKDNLNIDETNIYEFERERTFKEAIIKIKEIIE